MPAIVELSAGQERPHVALLCFPGHSRLYEAEKLRLLLVQRLCRLLSEHGAPIRLTDRCAVTPLKDMRGG